VAGPIYSPVDGGSLATWDTRALPVGRYTLRVRAWDRSGHEAEARVRVNVEPRLPTATPTLLPTAVTTPTPTATFVPPATPTPTVEPPTPVPSDTPPLPTETPTPAVTATPEPGATLILRVDSPQPGDEVSGDVVIVGVAGGTAFASYSLEFGLGPLPAEWVTIVQDVTVPVPQSDVLALWSTAELADGTYTVRLLGWRVDGSSETVSVTVLVTNGSVAG
jgi:hypothetical protein